MDNEFWLLMAGWVIAMLRSATPLLFVTLGETMTQRSGVINLGVEGEMLAGACFGFAVAVSTGSPWLGLVAGALAGAVLSLMHAGLVLGARANQIGSGIAVWMIALGTTSYFGRAFVGERVTPLPPLLAPGTGGSWLAAMLGQLSAPTPLAILAVLAAAWWLADTRAGLSWRVTGESARLAAENGLRPIWIRLQAIVLGGFLAGFGGAVLSIDYTQTWAQEITKGRGLIAVGLVIVARWQPILVLPVCLLFGLAEVAVLRVQAAGLVGGSSYLIATTPYLAVLAVLVVGHLTARRAISMPADLRAIFS